MKKRMIVTIAAITFLAMAALVFGAGRMQAASASTATAAHVQVKAAVAQARYTYHQASPAQKTQGKTATANGPETSAPEATEAPGSGPDVGGGHQDTGNADHQFDGNE